MINDVTLCGRLVGEIDFKVTEKTSITKFSIIINEKVKVSGKYENKPYFINNIACFGQTAEYVNKYLSKGDLIMVRGIVKPNHYEKGGQKVNTLQITANRVNCISKSNKNNEEEVEENDANKNIPF